MNTCLARDLAQVSAIILGRNGLIEQALPVVDL
jgi:hypothetical protein